MVTDSIPGFPDKAQTMFLSYQMRLVIRKNLSSGFGTRVDSKLTCAVTEARLGLEIMAMETGGIKLPRQ